MLQAFVCLNIPYGKCDLNKFSLQMLSQIYKKALNTNTMVQALLSPCVLCVSSRQGLDPVAMIVHASTLTWS